MPAIQVNKICIQCDKEFVTNSGSQKTCAPCKNSFNVCQCSVGCVKLTKNQYAAGHNVKTGTKKDKTRKLCACAMCGMYAAPGRQFINGHNRQGSNGWNKNLTRETHPGVAKTSEKLRGRPTWLKGLTKETDERVALLAERSRIQCIKQLEEGTIGWHLSSQESYPESVFRQFLESMGAVKGVDFFQEYSVWRYRLDFVFIDELGKRCIEIDGGQHEWAEQQAHDQIRDEYLKSQGWQILRIPVSVLYKFLAPLWPNQYLEKSK